MRIQVVFEIEFNVTTHHNQRLSHQEGEQSPQGTEKQNEQSVSNQDGRQSFPHPIDDGHFHRIEGVPNKNRWIGLKNNAQHDKQHPAHQMAWVPQEILV